MSVPTSGSGWLLAPLPLLGVLLLAIGGAWLLAGRRSERLAFAGSGAAAAAGMRVRTGASPVSLPSKFTLRTIAELGAITTVVIASVVAVQAFVIKPVVIPSESMAPTLVVGQHVMMERVTQHFGAPDRGDIVVFKPPGGVMQNECGVRRLPDEPCARPTGGRADSLYIKRIVAEPGDRLKILQGQVYIDGKLQPEPQNRAAVDCNLCNLPREITIPPAHYFVMGDNRGQSIDSRTWGPVSRDQIIGRAVFSFWPPRRFGSP